MYILIWIYNKKSLLLAKIALKNDFLIPKSFKTCFIKDQIHVTLCHPLECHVFFNGPESLFQFHF